MGVRSARLASVVVVGAAVLFPLEVAAADRTYAVAGTLATETATDPTSGARVVRPSGQGTFPLVVASHGFSASGDNQIGWARHFASWGFVVAVPSFPSPFSPDHQANAKTVASIVKELTGASAATFHVAPGKYGLEGHSAGGLSTTLAAAELAPAAVVLFDPVDANDAGKAAYGKLCAPVLGIFAAPSSCNGNAGWRAFANGTKSDVLAFDVVGSTHCDGENEPRSLCGTFCGGAASPTRQAVYAHYATAFFLARLSGNAGAAAQLAEAAMSSDAEITGVLRAAATCTPPAAEIDGGSTPPPGPEQTGDAGPGASGSPLPSAPSAESPAPATNPEPSGCGCRLVSGRSATSFAALAVALAALMIARRRR